jgi:IclR family acetate operon transcriptional repressor
MTNLDRENESDAAADEKLVGAGRVLAVLTELAEHPAGVGLDDIARAVKSPKSTVHRALAALRKAGFAHQDGRGHYVLGDKFLKMAFAHHEARPDHVRIQGVLRVLADRYGETAHYTVLDGRSVVYRSKVDPPAGAVKLTSTVGGRNPAHATAAGKLLLANTLPDRAAVRAWVGDLPLERPTANTFATVDDLHDELIRIRELGYSVDDEENEAGVNCVAVAGYLMSPTVPSGAISISAVAYRTPLHTLIEAVPDIRRALADEST